MYIIKIIKLLFKIIFIKLLQFKRSIDTNGTCLVRLDAIGDFILWLQTAKYYRDIYPNKKITLICNHEVQDFASNLKIFDAAIGINSKILTQRKYFWSTIKSLTKYKFDSVICDMYSRDFNTSDIVVFALRAKNKIGVNGDLSNTTALQRLISDKWYTKLINIDNNIKFEINKNFAVIKNLVPSLNFEFINILNLIKSYNHFDNKKYIVINFGAGNTLRQWPIDSFINLINNINQKIEVIIVGSNNDAILFKANLSLINRPYTNLMGQVSLIETISLIAQAKLFIGNETSTIHIAAAVNTPSICILGGGHYERFMPYDINQKWNWPQAVNYSMSCYNCNWSCIYQTNTLNTFPCIQKVEVDQVLKLINKFLLDEKIIDE